MTFFNKRIKVLSDIFNVTDKLQLTHNYLDANQKLDGRTFSMANKKVVNFASCSYLGLELDKRVKQGIIQATEEHGASFIMSRAYASSPSFASFEEKLAQIFGAFPVVTPSTTLGTLSFMQVFVKEGDLVVLDEKVHNSVQLSSTTVLPNGAEVTLLPHNDMDALEQLLEENKDRSGNVWYCADGIYSMFGDLIPVEKVVALLDRYSNFYTYIDDAHGMSIHGKHGRGYVLGQVDQQHEKMIVAVSLSKSFGMGCGGVLVFPTAEWAKTMQNCGPAMIFSTPVPPPMLGAGLILADIHLSEEIYDLQDQLFAKIKFFRKTMAEIGLPSIASKDSPVQFIKFGEFELTTRIVNAVLQKGFFGNIASYPAVGRMDNGLRLTMTNHIEEGDIIRLADAIASAYKSQTAMVRAA